MPHYLHPVAVRMRLRMTMSPVARAGALAAGAILVAAGGAIPFALLARLSALGFGGPIAIPATLVIAAVGGLVAWWGALLAWSSLQRTARLSVADENIVIRHQAWLRAPLVIYRSQARAVRFETRTPRGFAHLGLPGRANVHIEFNEPKLVDGLRPSAEIIVARRRHPLGLALRVDDVIEAKEALRRWTAGSRD